MRRSWERKREVTLEISSAHGVLVDSSKKFGLSVIWRCKKLFHQSNVSLKCMWIIRYVFKGVIHYMENDRKILRLYWCITIIMLLKKTYFSLSVQNSKLHIRGTKLYAILKENLKKSLILAKHDSVLIKQCFCSWRLILHAFKNN